MTFFDHAERRAVVCLLLLLLLLAGCSSDDDPVSVDPVSAYVLVEYETEIGSWDYLDNRFFFLDLPSVDVPGRDPATQLIDPASIQVYQRMSVGEFGPDDVRNVAVYRDLSGRWIEGGDEHLELTEIGTRWRRIEHELMLDENGYLVAIDVKREFDPTQILGVIYNVVSGAGNAGSLLYRVGDRPGVNDDDRITIDGQEGFFYRMKLLKAIGNTDLYTFGYALRNIYDLGSRNIDPENFDFRMERTIGGDDPERDFASAGGLSFIRIFGLDQTNIQGGLEPDGIADFVNPYLFDLNRGLLKFPLDFPEPFSASREEYEAYAGDGFDFDNSYVAAYLTPQIYDPAFHPGQSPDFETFKMIVTTLKWVPNGGVPELGDLSLSRLDWFWASAPVEYEPAERVGTIRWFLPRERTLRRYLNPSLGETAGGQTVDVMDLFMRADSGVWGADSWGGIMTGLSNEAHPHHYTLPVDLTGSHYFEIWINDGRPDPSDRRGTLHIDFGYISEDGFWPVTHDEQLVIGHVGDGRRHRTW